MLSIHYYAFSYISKNSPFFFIIINHFSSLGYTLEEGEIQDLEEKFLALNPFSFFHEGESVQHLAIYSSMKEKSSTLSQFSFHEGESFQHLDIFSSMKEKVSNT